LRLSLLDRLLLLVPARLAYPFSLLLEPVADRPHLLLDLLPHGLPEVLVELRQDGLQGVRKVLL
jgi:hypothetical protein